MASIKGSGPHHVEFGKPDFSGGKTRNRLSSEGSASYLVGKPPTSGHTITISFAFGKDAADAFDRLKTSEVVKHYSGMLAMPMDWEHEDDPGALGYAIEYLVRNPDGSLHDRLRIAYDVTVGVGGARMATDPRITIGFEGRVVHAASGYDTYFIWRPNVAEGFVKSKIADLPTFNKIWLPTLEIDSIDDGIFDAIPTGALATIPEASFLCKSSATTVHLVVASAWSLAGFGTAKKFKVQSTESFDYCGFNRAALVEITTMIWPPGTSLAAIPTGSPIDYTETTILSS